MKLAFLINRANNFRHFASIIETALKRGHTVECWHDYYSTSKDSAKGYIFPEISKSPFAGLNDKNFTARAFTAESEHNRAVTARTDIDYFISLSPPEFILDKAFLDSFRGNWVMIMHGPDSFKEIKNIKPGEMGHGFRRIFSPYTENFFNEGLAFFKSHVKNGLTYFAPEHTEIHPVGCTMFGPELLTINKSAIRRKFGIPPLKNILVYLPYTYSDSKKHKKSFAWQAAFAGLHIKRRIRKEFENNAFTIDPLLRRFSRNLSALQRILQEPVGRKWLFNGWNEPAVITAVRAFCDANNLHLVVKPRRKFDFSEAVYEKADLIIDDDESQQYPSKLQELLSIAELCMGYFSTAVIESIYCGTPFINLQCPDELFYDPHQHFWCPTSEGSLFSLNGAVWGHKIPDFIRDFGSAPLKKYQMTEMKREEYMKKFTGMITPSAAENLLNHLEAKNLSL
jgi:hypothetical protein